MYLLRNGTFCHFFLDFTLFHHFWSNFAPNIVNIGNFALKKMRRNSGEPRKMILSDGQSWHLRISKIYGSSGWNCAAPQLKHWKAPIDPKTIHRAEIHQHGPFWDVLGTYRSSKRTIFTLKCPHWEKRWIFTFAPLRPAPRKKRPPRTSLILVPDDQDDDEEDQVQQQLLPTMGRWDGAQVRWEKAGLQNVIVIVILAL